jgi:FkbM family methyltransferase
MPSTRLQRARTKFRVLMPWRRLMPHRTVRRQVRGVDLYMPWSHALPDYSLGASTYGLNLIELADALAGGSDGQFRFVDIGANIGDSALQILDRVDGKALCVEGDEYWQRYLRMNTGKDPRVTIEEVMLSPAGTQGGGVTARRSYGTTTFVQDDQADESATWVSVDDLRERNPDFANARLIKTDTDGYDPVLVPALARAWSQSGPVLFFEFDPTLAREVGTDPDRLWGELADLGYSRLAVWDDTGDPLGQLDVAEAPEAATGLEPRPRELGYSFWDVAACRGDDGEAASAFDELVGAAFDPSGVSAARGGARATAGSR